MSPSSPGVSLLDGSRVCLFSNCSNTDAVACILWLPFPALLIISTLQNVNSVYSENHLADSWKSTRPSATRARWFEAASSTLCPLRESEENGNFIPKLLVRSWMQKQRLAQRLLVDKGVAFLQLKRGSQVLKLLGIGGLGSESGCRLESGYTKEWTTSKTKAWTWVFKHPLTDNLGSSCLIRLSTNWIL